MKKTNLFAAVLLIAGLHNLAKSELSLTAVLKKDSITKRIEYNKNLDNNIDIYFLNEISENSSINSVRIQYLPIKYNVGDLGFNTGISLQSSVNQNLGISANLKFSHDNIFITSFVRYYRQNNSSDMFLLAKYKNISTDFLLFKNNSEVNTQCAINFEVNKYLSIGAETKYHKTENKYTAMSIKMRF